MNGSWSDQDLGSESDLVIPDSQSGTSEGEFESFEDAGHRHPKEENMDYEDQTENGPMVNSDGLPDNNGQSTAGEEEEEDGDSYNSSEHHHLEVASEEEEAAEPREEGLEEPVIDDKRQTVINMHHVDLILDNIDAELNDIINRSRNSEHSENSYHGNGTSSGTSRQSQKAASLTRQEPELSDSATADDALDDDSASDTGLGTGSHRGDSSPVPNGNHAHHMPVHVNGERTGARMNGSKRVSTKKKVPRRQVMVDFSDGDSICSDDVRMRMEETLNLQDSDNDALPSQHSHNPSHTHDALQTHDKSLPSSATASNSTRSWNRERRVPAEANQDRTEASSQSDDNHETQEISSRIQEMVSHVLSDSTSDPLFDEAPSPNLSHHQSQNLLRTNHDAQRTPSTKGFNENGRTHQSLAPNSQSFLEHRRAGRGIDADSIATEDFEHVFQKSIVAHDPPSTTNNRKAMQSTRNNPSNTNQQLPSASPKKTDRLTVPGIGKRGKSRSKKKRTNTMPTSKPSGLPEYMYLRKGTMESDVGSDSIRTEDYEGHFQVARVLEHNSPKYANRSNIARGQAINIHSDPESIQTEEYEQRFRSLMVKQVAGVPVKSFDQVTIASDLESVETGMVHETFQEALRKGPEVRVFNEFGDQSDLDPLQMEEVERKFQAIVRKKKKEKMRRSQKGGDTEDEGTSDLDSVRAVPSKSETGSPPNRQPKNGRSKGHRHHNGAPAKPSSRSRDAAPRANAYNTRSSPRGAPGSPVRSQLTSPWSTPQDISPSLPQRSPAAVATAAVHFPFNHCQPAAAKSCGNHPDLNPAREQASFPSWQDPTVGRQRAAAWNAQRQDTFSTYEEVESLHSHQCSSLQSLDNSCAPSRLQSFGSTSSSLDQSHPQVEGGPWAGGLPAGDHLFDNQWDDQGSSLTSDSTQSASVEGGRSGHLKEKSRRSLIDDEEDEMNSSVAKWVDQTRAETARRRSYVGLPEDPLVRSHEAPEGGQQSCDLSKERSLTALKMQCGDVIPGKSGRRMRLPNETDLELALRVGNASPVSMISRCASLDSSHSSTNSEHPEGDWTIAEDVLINLGFGGANMGIPSRFLKSWKEQVIKQRVEEVRRLLGNTTSNHLFQQLPARSEKTHSPKEKVPKDRHNPNLPSISTCSPKSSSTSSLVSESSNSHKGEDSVMSRQRGADKTKLVNLRRSLKKAATVSSFGQTLSEINNNSRQGPPNHQVQALQQGEQPPAARRSPGGGKYSPFKSHKSSARDRRRKYMKKQSSLPISLETLQEEDESLKPGLVKSKQADSESPVQKSLLRPQSLEVGDQPAFHCKLKIVMEQPSVESREAMSRQGTTDVDVDEAIADVDTDKKDPKVSMEQYLVVKAIIDSKDSGFENEPSRTGSPQISPRSSEDETVKGTCSKTVTTADSSAQRTRTSDIAESRTDSLLVIVPSKESSATNEANQTIYPDENFQGRHIKQEQPPSRERFPMTESKLTSEPSSAVDLTTAPIPQTRSTKLNGRSSSTTSDRRGPSLADIQDDFHQTIEEEDNDVFDAPVGGHVSESVSACCQTSPTLHSPLLSPLFFLGSISEHPESLSDSSNSVTNVSPEIFVMPSGSPTDVSCEKVGVSAERHDSLESVKTTVDGLATDSSPRNLSQEISDGGLSIITEKDEEQGLGQETSDQVSLMDKAVQDNQDPLSPLSIINNKTSGISGQNSFQFEDLPKHSEPTDPTNSNPVEKSRNPFKSSDSFYSSPRHSKADFDFDATIEEDEDGEQYSDGESFSKVTFPELSTMMYEASNAPVSDDNSEESHNSSPCPSKDDLNPMKHFSHCSQTNLKTDISTESAKDKSVTEMDFIGLGDYKVEDETDCCQKRLVSEDFTENSPPAARSDDIIWQKQPISDHDIPNAGGDETTPAISIFDGKESEDKLTSYEKNSGGCRQSDCPGNCEEHASLWTNELTKDTVPANHPGEHSQFPSTGHFIIEQAAYDKTSSTGNPDQAVPQGDILFTKNDKNSDLELANSLRQDDKAHFTSEGTTSFFALKPMDRHTQFLDRLHRERNVLEDWKLGLEQPQIMRSTSVEAHLNFQRKKLRTLSERSTLYSDGMEPLLLGFGRIITERSSSSTEGFGSLGSDIFRRPLTTTQTLQQVAAKLASHIRQRSLVSIQDDESEEEKEEREADESQAPHKQRNFDSTEEKNAAPPDDNEKWKKKLEENEGYKKENFRCESNSDIQPVSKATTNPSKKCKIPEDEVTNNSNFWKTKLENDNTILASDEETLEVETKFISPNIHIDGASESMQMSETHVQNVSASSKENSTGTSKDRSATSRARQRSWQFQATASRKSSNFLSVPSFGPLNDPIDESSLSTSVSAGLLKSNLGDLQEMTPDLVENCDSEDSKKPGSQRSSQLSEVSDEKKSLEINELEASYKIIMEHVVVENDQDVADEFKFDPCTDMETGCTECKVSNLTEPGTAVEFNNNGPILKQMVVVSIDHLEDYTPSENEKGADILLDKNDNPSHPTLLYPSYNSVSEVENERDKLKSPPDFAYINLLPTNGPNLVQEVFVVHSQYYRSEKFVNVSVSSDGKVDFTEAGEDNDQTFTSHQIPTFLSEVKFPALSRRRLSSERGRKSISSQGSRSLECPSPVPSSRLSPTFEEICTKAGNLMQQLQDALASKAPEDLQKSQIEENQDEENQDKEFGEVQEEEETEENGFTRDQQVNSHPRDNSHRRPGDAPRMQQENKKKKKRPLRDNSIKTSTPKARPGLRHQGDSERDAEGDVEDEKSTNHQATIRELLEAEAKMRRKLGELESSFEEVSSRKQDTLDDLKTLREAVRRNKRDIQKAEEIARENMERADGLRSELMVLEYQRDQAKRDLDDLTQSIGSFQQPQQHGLLEEDNSGTGNNLLGLSPKEVIAVIKERDELKTRLRNGEGDLSPLERSELERQLNSTKQELFNGQKTSREKLESLEEVLEESRHRMEELLVEKTNLAEKVKELQALVGSEQNSEMHSHLQERNQILEQLTSKLQKELDALRHQAHERDQRLQTLTATASEKDALNSALRDKMVAMQQEAEEERKEADRRVKEAEGKVRNADVAKELALVELRESLLKEKEEEMEQLKLSLEKEKKEALAVVDEKTSEIMNITQRSLAEKEEDLKTVKLQLVEHKEEASRMEQQLREQAEEQIKTAVDKERRDREEEYSRRQREESVEKELEVAKETSRLQGELHVARQRLEHSQTTVGVLKEELDKLRESNLAAGREKVEAVSEAREKAREDIQRELDQLREQLAKENLLEADRLRMKLRQQEEELTKLRSEVKAHQDKEAKSTGMTGNKSILAEINEECKRTEAVIGSTPRKMNISRIKASKSLNGTLSPKNPLNSSTLDSTHGPGRTQVMAALTNLRISNEELRNYIQTLKTDLERQKRALSKVQKEKDEEVKKVANTIEKKSGDMDTMRDRLIQDHLSQVEELQQQVSRQRTTELALQQRLLDKDSELREIQHSMTLWKEETALKMAKKFEEELGKELEIRLQEGGKRDGSSYRGSQSDRGSRNSSGNGSPSIVSSASDASTIRLLRHLQERVKQLRTENMSLRRSSRGPLESSGEDRASPHSSRNSESEDKDHLLYQLQQRVKLLERQLQVAEERCRDNAASVSEKTSENSRLQGALTQQTKELMKMERAYSKLATPGRTPVRL